jgi:hypothetical protein
MSYFSVVPDPRLARGQRHRLLDITVISVMAVICGAQGWTEREAWPEGCEDWLKTFLELPHAIPSADTFARIFSILDSEAFERCFSKWACAVNEASGENLSRSMGKQSAVPSREKVGHR